MDGPEREREGARMQAISSSQEVQTNERTFRNDKSTKVEFTLIQLSRKFYN